MDISKRDLLISMLNLKPTPKQHRFQRRRSVDSKTVSPNESQLGTATFQKLQDMSLNAGFTHPHTCNNTQTNTKSQSFCIFSHLTPSLPLKSWCQKLRVPLWSLPPVSPPDLPRLGWAMHQHTASCRAQVFQQEPKVS